MRARLLRPIDQSVEIKPHREWTATIGDKPLGIGIKPHGINLTCEDYKMYMRTRDALLSGPARRAALLEGGIVWRLAWTTCSIEETSSGPDINNELSHGQIKTLELGGKRCAETILSQQDQYIIVGVYRVLRTAAITSWWPTSEVWASSGYAVGYWSYAAESWFQQRLKRIRSGDAMPMNSAEWRNSLRHTVLDSRGFISNIEKLSAYRV
ncbi:hypothetical protein BDY19DRAFT_896089 [Irpex rosettiformis]|uniref:Uncharacterized protein n=1 Tax=Irpex rosettiformis TaxID=378272 RepID=A0ACB8TUH5_9APHY|nr:hypothetical protein BDY19DRAFT_896089 [Irpex rosettiformis]